jgi:colanic acid biosynthesis protein WcaH
MTTRLDQLEFAQVVRMTPLVSIDLIIRDPDGKILVGLRTMNRRKGSISFRAESF